MKKHAGDTLTPDEAAEYLGLSKNTLAGWRRAGAGPDFRRESYRVVTYRRADLDAFKRQRSTGARSYVGRMARLEQKVADLEIRLSKLE